MAFKAHWMSEQVNWPRPILMKHKKGRNMDHKKGSWAPLEPLSTIWQRHPELEQVRVLVVWTSPGPTLVSRIELYWLGIFRPVSSNWLVFSQVQKPRTGPSVMHVLRLGVAQHLAQWETNLSKYVLYGPNYVHVLHQELNIFPQLNALV